MMKNTFAAIILMTVFMTGAAADEVDQRTSALIKAFPNKEFMMMVVPEAGNFISNKLIVASLKAGTDNQASEKIAKILQRPSPVQLAITSENDAVAHATLERALRSLEGKSLSAHEVAFIGDKEYEGALLSKAAELGINLTYVPYP